MDFDTGQIVSQHRKLMKKSRFLIVSFFLLFTIDLILFITFQKNPLFMFNLNRSITNVPNPLLTGVFSTVFYAIIALSIFFYIVFFFLFHRKVYKTDYRLYKRVHLFADFFSVVPTFLLIVMILNGFFISIAQVDGHSMEPTFCSNDTVIIEYTTSYDRDDILILRNDDSFLIKRVVGLPGDSLLVSNSGVYINGHLIESNLPAITIFYNLTIPEGSYYVLGDNRDNSMDSRVFGLVDSEDVLGEVLLRIGSRVCE